MATDAQLAEVEANFFRFIRENNILPDPDRVEHGADEVRFYWDERKLVVAVAVAVDRPEPGS